MDGLIWIGGIACLWYTIREVYQLTQAVNRSQFQAWDQEGRPLKIEVLR